MGDIIDSYKSLSISIRTVTKYLKMLKIIPDYLKTKAMCKHALKTLPYILRCVHN